jgi:hypothetical protein
MSESILNSVKKNCGLAESYTAFDPDIIMYINAAFSTLEQLGVGPVTGFMITGTDEEWDDLLMGDMRLNNVKTYVTLRVQLLFDPPTTSYLIDAKRKQVEELEWRINVVREGDLWVDSEEVPVPDVIDGGHAGS